MNYTYEWNHDFVANSKELKNFGLCLEVGCFEGLTSNYIIKHMLVPNGKLICVDPLTDVYLNDDLSENDHNNNQTIYKYFNNQYKRFMDNTKKAFEDDKIILYRNISSEVYPELLKLYENQIDFIYIDGDHRPSAVYIDAVECLKLCRKGGFILFDDYHWGKSGGEYKTSEGIDLFLQDYKDHYELMIVNHQVLIKKK